MTKILEGLNQPQIEAVKAFKGPFLVIAGAGSGKTTALTRRIAYLIRERAVAPSQILAVTFTNKAAAEMRMRVAQQIDLRFARPLIGTFHSVCVKILREDIHFLGYDNSFSILDQQDQLVLIKKILKELDLPKQQFTPRAVLENISRAKNDLLSPDAFSAQIESYVEENIARVYDHYQQTLRENHSLDFDDLIRLTIALFKEHSDVLKKYQDRFHFVLVDEYQDTNYAQYTLIKMLTKVHQNIFVVGDDWQSIYKWRGADVSNILNFEHDFTKAKVIKLEQNYRSTQNILDAAYYVIKHNVGRSDKSIWTQAGSGNKLFIYEAHDEREEAMYIVSRINALKAEGYTESDFVVLYRTNAQSRVIEEFFLKNGVHYRIVGGIKFYERKEVKDMVAYMRLIINHMDILSLERAVSEPRRGIGGKTFAQWLDESRAVQLDPISFGCSAHLQKSRIAKSKKLTIGKFCQLIDQLMKYAESHELEEIITHIYEKSGYKSMLLDGTMEGEVRHENVQELLSVATKYDGMENAMRLFVEEISLASDTDRIDHNTNMVHLMTLHSAKGLEFPIVFITGLEEGLIPHSRSMVSEEEMEEERRLIYVGITRAKKQVYFLCTHQRLLFGSLQANIPSRFLGDIPDNLLERECTKISRSSYNVEEEKPKSVLYKPERDAGFVDGDKVRHRTFGVGIVVGQTDLIIHVVFKEYGLKKLAKSIAPLEKVV